MSSPDFLTCPAVPELTAGEAPVKQLPPPRSRSRIFIGLAIFFVLFFTPLFVGVGLAGYQAFKAESVWGELKQGMARGDVEQVKNSLRQLRIRMNGIHQGLGLTLYWRWMPWVGSQVASLEDGVQAGVGLLDSADELFAVFGNVEQAFQAVGAKAPFIDSNVLAKRSFQELTPDEKRTILSKAFQSLTFLRAARDQLSIALGAWEHVPNSAFWAPVRNRFASKIEMLMQAKQELDQVIPLAETFIPLAGFPQEKHYLVFLQNADELRPTGGFLGTVGTLYVDAADIKQFSFQDIYAVDGPVAASWKDLPPEPLARELGIKAWFLRDSNWSPDFPQTAERLMDVYAREQMTGMPSGTRPLVFDGVIALQPSFFEQLLRLTGPITIDDKTFSAEDFFTQLEYDVELGFRADGKPIAQRKDILAKVGDGLVAALERLPAARWNEVFRVVSDALTKKDMLLYVREDKLLHLLDQRGWTGRTQSPEGDYVWVVDANMAALKTDGVMEKEIQYKLDLHDPEHPLATVSLNYRNTNRVIDWRRTRYRDYVRLYVPEGSEFVTSTGAMAGDLLQTKGIIVPGKVDVGHDLGKTVFGAFWAIEPGATGTLSFTYRLPTSIADMVRAGTYNLFVQKQPGSKVRLTLDLFLGKKLTQASPPEAAQDFGDATYRVTLPLEQDQAVNIKF